MIYCALSLGSKLTLGALLFINRVEYTPPRDLDPQELLLGPNEYFKLCKSYIFLEE